MKTVQIITQHIESNIREYIAVTLIFIVGIMIGIMLINTAKEEQKNDISAFITNYIDSAKQHEGAKAEGAMQSSIRTNIMLAFALWLSGTTVVGIPVVAGIILYRGFCLGYTISACTYTLGIGKATAFTLTTMLLHNILLIPAVLALGVSGIKLSKSIIKDRNTYNIKAEILRHTAFSSIMLVILIISAIVKTNATSGLMGIVIKYF